jgi:hypothetical protein
MREARLVTFCEEVAKISGRYLEILQQSVFPDLTWYSKLIFIIRFSVPKIISGTLDNNVRNQVSKIQKSSNGIRKRKILMKKFVNCRENYFAFFSKIRQYSAQAIAKSLIRPFC